MTAERTQRQFGMALVWYLVGVIAIITLVPMEFRWPTRFRLVGFTTTADVVRNVALFIPLGFFIGFARGRRAALAGFVLSVAVESLQQVIPGRSPSLLDVVTNTSGAWIGGALHQGLERILDRDSKTAGIRVLDLPLLGLAYLLVPLLWLSGLGAGAEPDRRWLVTLPGLTIAILFASVSRHHLEPRGFSRAKTALIAGAVVALGLVPGWHGDPRFLLGMAGVVSVLVMLFGDELARSETVGRRFEIPTVFRAMAPFAIFVVLAAVWPLEGFGGPWKATAGFSRPVHAIGEIGILRLLELIAAASVLGYAAAEVAGRSLHQRAQNQLILTMALAIGAGLVVLRGFHPRQGASVIEAVFLAVATWVGAELYWRQRAFILARLRRVETEPAALPETPYGRMEPVPAGEGAP